MAKNLSLIILQVNVVCNVARFDWRMVLGKIILQHNNNLDKDRLTIIILN